MTAPKPEEKPTPPDWRGDVLSIHTARCVLCGKNLADVFKAGGEIVTGGHLCTYRGESHVLASFCRPCRDEVDGRTVKFIPAREGCSGCYGFWSVDRHGARLDRDFSR